MKKIMFNERMGLHELVLKGGKTMTRRIINEQTVKWLRMQYGDDYERWLRHSPYMPYEVVAIAQSYRSIINDDKLKNFRIIAGILEEGSGWTNSDFVTCEGYRNKMFVKAEYMPHQIMITSYKVERLQDISDEDCLKEGIRKWKEIDESSIGSIHENRYAAPSCWDSFPTPQEAFAWLINKVGGKGTWESNPLVWAYDYQRKTRFYE